MRKSLIDVRIYNSKMKTIIYDTKMFEHGSIEEDKKLNFLLESE